MPILIRTSRIDNISEPSHITYHSENSAVVFSDLDGNALSFLHRLLREGFVKFSRRDCFEKFKKIYYQPKLTKESIKELIEILKHLTFGSLNEFGEAIIPFLLLIGDELADRGRNDFFILLLLIRLSELNIKFSIILSNHGLEFLCQYIYGIDEEYIGHFADIINEKTGINHKIYGRSLHALRQSISGGIISKEEISSIVNQYYLPHLQLLRYEILEDTKQVLLYTHARIDRIRLAKLAIQFNVNYQDDTLVSFTHSLDALNERFQEILSDPSKRELLLGGDLADELELFVSSRTIQDIHTDENQYDYSVINIHGHMNNGAPIRSCSRTNWNHCNTDWRMLISDTGGDDPTTEIYLAYTSVDRVFGLEYGEDASPYSHFVEPPAVTSSDDEESDDDLTEEVLSSDKEEDLPSLVDESEEKENIKTSSNNINEIPDETNKIYSTAKRNFLSFSSSNEKKEDDSARNSTRNKKNKIWF